MGPGIHHWDHTEIVVLWYIESTEASEGTRRQPTRRNCIRVITGRVFFIFFLHCFLFLLNRSIWSLQKQHYAVIKEFGDWDEVNSQCLPQERDTEVVRKYSLGNHGDNKAELWLVVMSQEIHYYPSFIGSEQESFTSLVSVSMLTMILRKISEVIYDFAGSLLDKYSYLTNN